MKAFWLSYAFWFSTTFMMAFVNGDFIKSAGISFMMSVAVYVFFEFWFFESDSKEELPIKESEDEYITLFTWK